MTKTKKKIPPPVATETKRTQSTVRLSPEVFSLLDATADAVGMTKQGFLTASVLSNLVTAARLINGKKILSDLDTLDREWKRTMKEAKASIK